MIEESLPQSNTSESRPRWRPQISLLTLFLLITIAALSISHFLQSRKLTDEIEALQERCEVLYAEKIHWKTEAGVIEPVDVNLICATQLPTFEPDTLRFRVYFPPNRWYKISHIVESIPEKGVVATDHEYVFQSEPTTEYDDQIFVKFNEKSVTIECHIGKIFGIGDHSTTEYPADRQRSESIGWESQGVERGKLSVNSSTKEPFVLLRKCEILGSRTTETAKSGLLLWIEEIPDPNVKSENKGTEKKE